MKSSGLPEPILSLCLRPSGSPTGVPQNIEVDVTPKIRARTKIIILSEQKGLKGKGTAIYHSEKMGVGRVSRGVGNVLTLEVAICGSCDEVRDGIEHKESRVRS